MGLIVATLIDIAVDGFIIGASFSTGGNTGPILAIGLSVELLFLGLALMSDALKGWRILAMTVLIGAEVLTFALLGNWLLAGASHAVIGGALSFSAAALLYLVTEELLMEAHTVQETRWPRWCCLPASWRSGPSSCWENKRQIRLQRLHSKRRQL